MADWNNKSNFYSKERRLSHLYFIVNKDRKKVPLIRNKAQRIVADTKKMLRQKYWRVRLFILKWRQLWITTDACLDNTDDAMLKKNMHCMITAHKLDKQKEIFKKVDYAYTNFPRKINLKNWKVFIKPKTRLKNVNELFFKDNNNKWNTSSIQVSLDARSWTYNSLHLTEIAFRRDAEEMMTWTMPAIPPNGDVVIETTANGIGNYAHQLRVECYWVDNAPFYCLFLWWWLADEYREKLLPWEKLEIPDKLAYLNRPMMDWTILDEEQKKWYIQTAVLLKEKMAQEYPCTPEEAFLNSWTTVFDLNTIKAYNKLNFEIDEIFPDLRIYKPAKYGFCMYGVDTAEGWPKGDNSSIRVRDENLNLLAEYYWICEPDQLCLVIDRLVNLWYVGRMWIERNNTGLATLVKAKEYWWYSLIFTERTIDTKTKKPTQKIGWHTNSKTRPVLLADYISLVKDGSIIEIDERLRHEMYSFIYNDRNRPEASIWNHDDAIMSDAICCLMRNYAIVVDQTEQDNDY